MEVAFGLIPVDGLSGEQRANLAQQALSFYHEKGADIVSLTCDGAASNLSMLRSLGCELDLANLNAVFQHPVTKEPVFPLMDACHMLKLIRNTLYDKKALFDANGQMIHWKFIDNLHELQYREGLHCANKLRQSHINWKSQPMKVSLAAQTLSSSVADVLAECRARKIPEF